MAIERWDPFREAVSLRDAMNSLLQESFVRPAGFRPRAARRALPLDVSRDARTTFVVKASLPGVKPEDVQITVHGDTLTIRGETKAEEEKKGEHWHLRERRFGAFQRSVSLATPVDSDKAEAHFEHGVLTLTLPKSEAAKPRQIKIGGPASSQAGSGGQGRRGRPFHRAGPPRSRGTGSISATRSSQERRTPMRNRTLHPAWKSVIVALAALLVLAGAAWAQQAPATSAEHEGKAGPVVRTFGAEGGYRTEVKSETQGALSQEDRRQVSLLAAQVFQHVDEAQRRSTPTT